jgi:hypothetical protein
MGTEWPTVTVGQCRATLTTDGRLPEAGQEDCRVREAGGRGVVRVNARGAAFSPDVYPIAWPSVKRKR